MLSTFQIITVILVILTTLPFSRHEAWWIRGLDFPRLQLFLALLIILFLELMLLDLSSIQTWAIIVIALFCLAYQAWWIVPYTRGFPLEVEGANDSDNKRRIKIITANVLMTNRNAKALIALIREFEPDILVTLESDIWWQKQLDILEADYPYTIKCPLDNLYGMHVYSKFLMMNSQIEYLVEPDKPSMHALALLPSGDRVRLHFLHPAPPSPTENDESSERDAELVIVAKSVADTNVPVIVTGDLNDVAWSETTRLFRKISGLLDPRVGRGMFNTFHADYWFLRWPLDHLFHSKHFSLQNLKRLSNIGSDHFPLYTELVLTADNSNENNGLNADMDDLVWAKFKTKEHNVDKTDVPQPEKHLVS
ncbi:endonuclease/exonuclease/phosphatase family protein [Nitrosomonas supralitoralis]|uniref:Endonuclease n=1 Tax=Nitrosomonas supralitoralis TaxID=2116706 RepID=A0A2P7NV20_9PROT|nr:endonuclease/exonuclease/phosphatase family protein [Nitrosomonas supralitoralis]PSJ17321.1 endonuclease [Nitrosomonas supralitoralis]